MAVASAVVLASQAVLTCDRETTESLLAKRQTEVAEAISKREAVVRQAGAELEDAIRKQMTQLGFNILILPASQDLGELHLNGTLSATMPAAYASRLADSGVVTINHLLPMVTQRVDWPEREIEVLLVGTEGELAIQGRDAKKPLLAAVGRGEMVLGHGIAARLGVAVDDTVEFRGESFRVAKIHDERGSIDDMTVWIDLSTAQELLGLQNLINGLLALECGCEGDRISEVRAEIQTLLPGTQVVERYSQALTRAEARSQAKRTAEAALAAEQAAGADALEREAESRAALEQRHAEFANRLVPLTIAIAAVTIGLLAFWNVRQRREEIGLFRSIGYSRLRILTIFEVKGILIGMLGGLAGAGLAILLPRFGLLPVDTGTPTVLGDLVPRTTTIMLVGAPLLSAVSTWLPAVWAAAGSGGYPAWRVNS
ncbi:MAG: ABC transporter permease [Planctomycetaceae bacterium]